MRDALAVLRYRSEQAQWEGRPAFASAAWNRISALREFLRRIGIPFKDRIDQRHPSAGVSRVNDKRLADYPFRGRYPGRSMRLSGESAKLAWLLKPSRTERDPAILGGGSAGLSARCGAGASEGTEDGYDRALCGRPAPAHGWKSTLEIVD